MEPGMPHRGSAQSGESSAAAAARIAFPQTPDEFETDERVSYSKLEEKWILEDDDGSEWDFDEARNRWVPSLDEALLERQRQAYAVQGIDENEPAQPSRKRKTTPSNNDDTGIGRPAKSKKPSHPQAERKNTAVYVTSLPLDTTVSEVASVFSRCGVIAEEIDSGKSRIKLYTDEQGKFKGDALVVYFRPESVALAIQMLDDSDFRLGEAGPSGNMRVSEAERSYKKQQEKPGEGEANNGSTGAARGQRSKDQKKVIKKTQKMNNKLADWSDDDTAAITDTSERYDKVVILKHMFTLQELEEDPAAILDIKEDIREECSKLGEVTNVVLMDREKDGVATVRFGNAEAARACVRLMDGRSFAGQKVEAYISDGNERFKKTSKKKSGGGLFDEDEEDEESGRLDRFGQFLEGDEDA